MSLIAVTAMAMAALEGLEALRRRLRRRTIRVQLENELAAAKGASRSPPTRKKPLRAILRDPLTVTLLTLIGVVIAFVTMVIAVWTLMITMAAKPRAGRPVAV